MIVMKSTAAMTSGWCCPHLATRPASRRLLGVTIDRARSRRGALTHERAAASSGGTRRTCGVMLRGQWSAVHGAVVASLEVGGRTCVAAAGDVVTNEHPREKSTGGR